MISRASLVSFVSAEFAVADAPVPPSSLQHRRPGPTAQVMGAVGCIAGAGISAAGA